MSVLRGMTKQLGELMRNLRVCAVTLFLVLSMAACGGHASSEAGGQGGPSEVVVRQTLKDYQVMRIPGSGFETFYNIKNIRRGEPLEANGNGDIPAGTILYPIKADSSDMKDHTFAFYQDSFGEWKFKQME